MIDYSALTLVADNYFIVDAGCCSNCGDDGCARCGWSGIREPHDADLSTVLHNLAVAGALCAAYRDGWCARAMLTHNISGVACYPGHCLSEER